MKPFWRNTLRVLKVIGKIFVWLTGADSPVNDNEKEGLTPVIPGNGKTPVLRAADIPRSPFFMYINASCITYHHR